MPPAAPLPTMITSHFCDPGLMDAARRCDSAVTAERSSSSVGSRGIRPPASARSADTPCRPGSGSPGTRAGPVALVAQLLVDPDLRGVVAADRRVLRLDEELLERRRLDARRRPLVAAHVGEQRLRLSGRKLGEGRAEPLRGLRLEGGQPVEPRLADGLVLLGEEEVDVVRDPCLLGAGRALVGGDDGLDEGLHRRILRGGEGSQRRWPGRGLDFDEGGETLVGEPGQERDRAGAGPQGLEHAAATDGFRGHDRLRRILVYPFPSWTGRQFRVRTKMP